MILLFPYTRFAHSDDFSVFSSPGLNYENVTLTEGESFYLHVKGPKRIASYSTSNFKVAHVTSTGKVNCLNQGVAIITVKHGDENFTCKVKVISENQS